MEASDVVGLFTVGGVGVLQGLATWRVWRSDAYERSHKMAQTRLIWLVPLLGASLVLMMLRDADRAGGS